MRGGSRPEAMFNGTIRTLEPRDLEPVEEILDLYWNDEFRSHLSDKLREKDSILTWLVAEEDGEVVGFASYRKAPERMKEYAKTDNVVEFYVGAVKNRGQGVGTALLKRGLEEVRAQGYTEAVFFSGDTHQDSWAFHDASGFKRVGESIAPSGENGHIWLMEL